MKTALVISSFVAASRVGANASAFCLRRLGVETLVLPTTLLGRHPGWGSPGGGPVDAAVLEDMWAGVRSQNLQIDAILTGYMASSAQAALAARIIDDVRKRNSKTVIVVDPVMGDHGQLYISKQVADAIKSELIPRADIITPNYWEFGFLTGKAPQSRRDLVIAAQTLAKRVLVTSVPAGDLIGALYIEPDLNAFVQHDQFANVPHGGGDALAGTFLAHLLLGENPETALSKSVAAIFEILSHASLTDAPELPLVQCQDTLTHARPLQTERLDFD